MHEDVRIGEGVGREESVGCGHAVARWEGLDLGCDGSDDVLGALGMGGGGLGEVEVTFWVKATISPWAGLLSSQMKAILGTASGGTSLGRSLVSSELLLSIISCQIVGPWEPPVKSMWRLVGGTTNMTSLIPGHCFLMPPKSRDPAEAITKSAFAR